MAYVFVHLAEWASQNEIYLILLVHTRHLLRLMDVTCYGSFELTYNTQCNKLMREIITIITRAPFIETTQYKRTGTFPLDHETIAHEYLAPAELYWESDSGDIQATVGVESGL